MHRLNSPPRARKCNESWLGPGAFGGQIVDKELKMRQAPAGVVIETKERGTGRRGGRSVSYKCAASDSKNVREVQVLCQRGHEFERQGLLSR